MNHQLPVSNFYVDNCVDYQTRSISTSNEWKSSNQHQFLPLATACKTSATTNINNMNHMTLFYEIILNNDIFQQVKEFLNDSRIGSNNLLNVSIEFHGL
jgi:hypothetical protein